jgi:hypothetical protein
VTTVAVISSALILMGARRSPEAPG